MVTNTDQGRSKQAPGPAKRRIIEAAARLFRSRGYARSTVRELADEVGILSGSLFHHFKSKDDILFAVMDEVIRNMETDLADAIGAAPTTRHRLEALVRVLLAFLHGPQGDATALLLYEWDALSDEGQARLLQGRARFFDQWQSVLEEASSQGLTKLDPLVLRQLLVGAIIWTANWYDPDGELSLQALEDSVIQLALK